MELGLVEAFQYKLEEVQTLAEEQVQQQFRALRYTSAISSAPNGPAEQQRLLTTDNDEAISSNALIDLMSGTAPPSPVPPSPKPSLSSDALIDMLSGEGDDDDDDDGKDIAATASPSVAATASLPIPSLSPTRSQLSPTPPSPSPIQQTTTTTTTTTKFPTHPSPNPTQAQRPLPTQPVALSSAELAIEAAEEQILAAVGDLCAPFERSNRHMQNALVFAVVIMVGQILVLVASYGNYSAWSFEKKLAEQIDAARLWKSRALFAAKAGKPSQRI